MTAIKAVGLTVTTESTATMQLLTRSSGRKTSHLDEVTCGSPKYLDCFGIPKPIDSLEGHQMFGFLSTATENILPLEFIENGELLGITLPTIGDRQWR